ncbi:MAG: GPW/gp25 family protein [Candidatus Accumulibacter phosphatis]|uniref:Baseplate wedge subunit n=1 Tax=Candidatus Accumulibacter cognatus TaxID=2954383 RepID=A0A080M1C1_9PROT|nr:GPW/gp25 family protein [Candidatus Accumulibacter cognatus]KFB75043.1 MAG: baseplate wedge subunit [Candidatus Accumulibacter cognatus]MCQ1550580.1 GPW/gp25 family protein [Candidatus Accumulibacter phosphatis]QLH49626.1 MAG: GPW/gp25 family protein [Candidatus Accumulibacter cognatus]
MSKPFLGVGWGFPLTLDELGFFNHAEYEESVRQSIWIILGTAKGERVMRPDFGCGIYDLVFEINSASTAGRVTQAIRQALLLFEPRIDVLDIQVQAAEGGEVLLISIDYEVRATNNAFNLVYPFYLDRSTSG